MLNCKNASQLASRAMDEKLPFWEKVNLKLHLILCRNCAKFTRQLIFLREASHRSKDHTDLNLSDKAKYRIQKSLKDQQPH